MKKILFKSVCLVLLCCGAALTANAQGIKVIKKNGTVVYYKASEVESVGVYGYGEEPDPDPQPGEHEWVDLGLADRTLWATCNVGASSPEQYGDYYAWGETEPKDDYSISEYKFKKPDSYFNVTKYCTDSYYGEEDDKTELEPEDDVATVKWGSGWQMPSVDQLQNLFDDDYTTRECTTLNGKKGIKITSKSNGNWIFLPAAGYRDSFSSPDVKEAGYYWSRSLYSNRSQFAYSLYFSSLYSNSDAIRWISRYQGQCVRPVRVKK